MNEFVLAPMQGLGSMYYLLYAGRFFKVSGVHVMGPADLGTIPLSLGIYRLLNHTFLEAIYTRTWSSKVNAAYEQRLNSFPL